jgi:hypothetical protein
MPIMRLVGPIGKGGIGPIGTARITGHIERKSPASIADLPISGESHVRSLSATFSDVRLWSHYANGHRGIAIEMEVDDSELLHKVRHKQSLGEFQHTLVFAPTALEVLMIKTTHWDSERAVRMITDKVYWACQAALRASF